MKRPHIPQHVEHYYRRVHSTMHLAYFAGVFVEGHGFYGTMGGLLFVIGLAGLLVEGNES